MNMLRALPKKKLAAVCLLAGTLVGIVGYIGYRMLTYKSASIHHHANFALYINGVRDEFKSFTFYEEVQACVDHGADNPKSRVHMHNQTPDVVHVHDGGVTWGHFFANLGYTLGDRTLGTDVITVSDEGDKRLRFILNGKPVDTVANRPIKSEDTLLINYGSEGLDELQQRAEQIPHTAHEFNGKHDPAGCAGAPQLTLTQRLKAALGVQDTPSQ